MCHLHWWTFSLSFPFHQGTPFSPTSANESSHSLALVSIYLQKSLALITAGMNQCILEGEIKHSSRFVVVITQGTKTFWGSTSIWVISQFILRCAHPQTPSVYQNVRYLIYSMVQNSLWLQKHNDKKLISEKHKTLWNSLTDTSY